MRLIRALIRAFTGLLVLWTALWISTGEMFAPVRAGLFLAPFLLGAAAVLVCCALLARYRAAAALAGLTAAILATHMPPSLFRLAPADTLVSEKIGITLTTLSNRTANTDFNATAAALIRHRADIFALQEVAEPAGLTHKLAGLYGPGRPVHSCGIGTYLAISRFAFGQPVKLTNNVAIRCPIHLPGGSAQLYLIHLPRSLTGTERQRTAAAQIWADIQRQTTPVIAAGDFNATPLTITMQTLGNRLVNAFDQSGQGAGFTFPTSARRLGKLGPFLRIDHVLVSPKFIPVSARAARWHPPGADHFPVEIVFIDQRAGSQANHQIPSLRVTISDG